jgi:hypothetical protein
MLKCLVTGKISHVKKIYNHVLTKTVYGEPNCVKIIHSSNWSTLYNLDTDKSVK